MFYLKQYIAFGLLFLLESCNSAAYSFTGQDSLSETDFEALPIISYDTNTGLGYGGKVFLLDFFSSMESLDFLIFNSTKGERWYRFKISVPDNEIRQGTKYDYAVDLILDYDKWVNYSYFGIGNSSSYKDEIIYTREPVDVLILLSRGFAPFLIAEIGFHFNSTSLYNIQRNSKNIFLAADKTLLHSLIGGIRYDTRNSFNNPSKGLLLQTYIEQTVFTSFDAALIKYELSGSSYNTIFNEWVWANRLSLKNIKGDRIPVQYLLPIGGNQTLRGYSQDRLLGRTSLLFNTEIRYPIYKRLGGILGIDAGNVWNNFKEINFKNWLINPTAGLRLYMDNFIVRADLGYSSEYIGFYLNFGHIF